MAVSAFLGGSKPSRFGNVRGDVAVSFSCDPDVAWKLVCPLINVIHGHGDHQQMFEGYKFVTMTLS